MLLLKTCNSTPACTLHCRNSTLSTRGSFNMMVAQACHVPGNDRDGSGSKTVVSSQGALEMQELKMKDHRNRIGKWRPSVISG